MLDPFHPARCQIGRGTQAGLFLEHFVCDVAHFEREARFVNLPTADREHLAADFPDMRSAPLDHIGRSGERTAEGVESFVGHSPHSEPGRGPLKQAPRQTRSRPSERPTEAKVECTITVTHVACLDMGGLSAQFSGTVKTAQGDAIPRSACVPSGISDTPVSAAKVPETRTALSSVRHSPSSRLTRLTAGPIAVKSSRSAAPILPQSISPRWSAAPNGSGGSPCARRSLFKCAIPTRAAVTARNAASQALRRPSPTTGKIAKMPSPMNFSTSPPKACTA